MRTAIVCLVGFAFLFGSAEHVTAEIGDHAVTDFLSNASIDQIDLHARDLVYDSSRDVIYATVDLNGEASDSLVTIDPTTLRVLSSVAVGSNPKRLRISRDNSRVYVGIDGELGFRYWEPRTSVLGPLWPSGGVAWDFVVSPSDPKVVIVARPEPFVYDDTGIIDQPRVNRPDSHSMAFVDPSTLVTFNNRSTGFQISRYSFDGQSVTFEHEHGGQVFGFGTEIESANGLIYGTDGSIVDPFILLRIGSFAATGALEPIRYDRTTYFFDDRTLRLFDNDTFALIDSVTFGHSIADDIAQLLLAGEDRLAYVSRSGEIGIISNIPASAVPEPSALVLLATFAGGLLISSSLRYAAIVLTGPTRRRPCDEH